MATYVLGRTLVFLEVAQDFESMCYLDPIELYASSFLAF